ncbi:choice-of-anchor Q domain-containing protein [Nodularia spumigena]|uniref:choice-of-anchor Q domain-containing protein n=1 Tax=Nodularia spumigena TaxID=70799 RepID=UPI002B1EAECC|nr:choice-of-anchor Q domain-containing protein [Nodularia spumigena]MEA5556276.1 choice-of-anchor Q domain-containing protein [Nodularia spumigena CH309]
MKMLIHRSGGRSRGSAALLSSACALALLAGSVHADTLHVPASFPTIQAAINAAVDGDHVLVAPGTYAERINLRGKAITVRSTEGAASTIIDGNGQNAFVVTINAGEGMGTVLDGFTITGAAGTLTGPGPSGGGVHIAGTSPRLTNLIITGNRGQFGAGMKISGGAPMVSSTRFEANNALIGGGIYVAFGAPILSALSFDGNTAVNNGGAIAVDGGSITLRNSTMTDNTANSFGGAIYMNHTNATISGVRAEGNGTVEQGAYGSLTFSTFGGGGLYGTNVSGQIRDSRFVDNAAAAGGGLYFASSSPITVVNTVVSDNLSGIAGAGVYANSASPNIINCTIVGNFPGGIFTTFNAFPNVRNTILARNGNADYVGVEVYGNGNTTLNNSVVLGPVLIGATIGAGVVNANPLLDANFVPLPGSPAIDAGDNGAVPAGITTDLLGNSRFLDDPNTPDTGTGTTPIVDVGAIEFVPEGRVTRPRGMPMRLR